MKILLFANTDWYLYNFRRSLAEKLRDLGWEVLLVSPSGKYGEKLRDLGFRWIPFDFSNKGMNPFAELAVLLKLINLYRSERPDLVHHFTIKCVLYGSIAAYLTGRIPTVNAVTGLGHVFTDTGIKMRLLRPIIKSLYRIIFSLNQAKMRVIFQNTEDRAFFEHNVAPAPESLHPGSGRIPALVIRGSGVDCTHFSPMTPAKEPPPPRSQLSFIPVITGTNCRPNSSGGKIVKPCRPFGLSSERSCFFW